MLGAMLLGAVLLGAVRDGPDQERERAAAPSLFADRPLTTGVPYLPAPHPVIWDWPPLNCW